MEITLRRAGMQTTVQDLGRPGYRADGVPLGGAMDRVALRIANLLVGNPEGAAALEFTLLAPELEFSADALIALTGGDFGDFPTWQPFAVRAGSVLALSAARRGCRGYLAIAGGFDIPLVLGSASAYLRAGFGGLHGRSLRAGDVLPAPSLRRAVQGHWRIDPEIRPAYSPAPTVRVIRGAQAAEFDPAFFTTSFHVTPQSDRMGLRLKGPPLVRRSQVELRSSTVAPGTVQVPPDGQPIVLMADAQTIGGYPQIAHVIEVDLPLVAQLRPGDALQFREVTRAEAQQLALAREHSLAMLQLGLAHKLA